MKPVLPSLFSPLLFNFLYSAYNEYLYSTPYITLSSSFSYYLKNNLQHNKSINYLKHNKETYLLPSIGMDIDIHADNIKKSSLKNLSTRLALSHNIGLKSLIILSSNINLYNYIFDTNLDKCKNIHNIIMMFYFYKVNSQFSIKSNTFRVPKLNNHTNQANQLDNYEHLKCNEITIRSLEFIWAFSNNFLLFPELHSFSIDKFFVSLHSSYQIKLDDNMPVMLKIAGIFKFFEEGFTKVSYFPRINIVVKLDFKSASIPKSNIDKVIEIITRFNYDQDEPKNIGSCSSKLDNAEVTTKEGDTIILHTEHIDS